MATGWNGGQIVALRSEEQEEGLSTFVDLDTSGPRYDTRLRGHSPGPEATALSTTAQEQALPSLLPQREQSSLRPRHLHRLTAHQWPDLEAQSSGPLSAGSRAGGWGEKASIIYFTFHGTCSSAAWI